MPILSNFAFVVISLCVCAYTLSNAKEIIILFFRFVAYCTSASNLSSFSATINLFYFYYNTKAVATKIKTYFTCLFRNEIE